MMFPLHLPSPSAELLNRCNEVIKTVPFDYDQQEENARGANYKVTSTSHTFTQDPEIERLALSEFQQFFPQDKFVPSIGVIRSPQPGTSSSFPPHADRNRIFALNYYVQEGGDNVRTVFYNKFHNFVPGVGTGKRIPYEELDFLEEYRCLEDTWYALNVRQVHSVENVMDTRVIFTLSFYEMTIMDFFARYASLIQVVSPSSVA